MGRRLHPAVAVLALPVAFATLAAQQNAPTAPPSTRVDYALTNVRIVTAPGKVIERGTVVTRDGRIVAVGANVQVPAGVAADPEVVRRRLVSWLRRRARAVAEQMIGVYAVEMRVSPTRLRIGDQSTRWGSASGDGTISLSWRLVLAPPSCFETLASASSSA